MPAYNFKKQFSEAVKSGRKTHTIRRKRKYPTKRGDVLFLYYGMMSKACELLKAVTCQAVKPLSIVGMAVFIDGIELNNNEITELAISDGFNSINEFYAFFENYNRDLEIIYWE